ncbi:MAG: MOSC domain-containing protein [Rhodospirillales bacterium]|nr:MOSC domain-containing protein [Rhodospirillales bacterium]
MKRIGKLESVWRYPVKSMRGEEVEEIYAAYTGLMGDRVYAVSSTDAIPEFPWHTNREHEEFVLYTPRFKNHQDTLLPPALEATYEEALNPPYPLDDRFAVEIVTPEGKTIDVDSPAFLEGLKDKSEGDLSLYYTQKNTVDCRPLSLFSLQTVKQLASEMNMELDKRRFRANFYADWDTEGGFYEDTLINRRLKIGERLEVMIIEPDPRCKSITIDPDTAETSPKILKYISRKHDNNAGVFAAVLKEGAVKTGDEICLLD